MPDPKSKDLILAEELVNEAKFKEALEIIEKFEKTEEVNPTDQISVLISKGKISLSRDQFEDAVEFGSLAYPLSKKLGLEDYVIEALILKIWERPEKLDESLEYISEAEKRLNSLCTKSKSDHSILKLGILFRKTVFYSLKGEQRKSSELALEGLERGRKINSKLFIGRFLGVIGNLYYEKGDFDRSLEKTKECLRIFKQLDFQNGVARSLSRLGWNYYVKGDLNQALKFGKESLVIKESGDYTLNNTKMLLGCIYREKGELDKALEYYKQAFEFGIDDNSSYYVGSNQTNIGNIYRLKGDLKQAEKYLKQSLGIDDSWVPLLYLLLICLDRSSYDEAQLYLASLKELAEQKKKKMNDQAYQIGKAFILKASNRMSDHVDAVRLLRKVNEEKIGYLQFQVLSIIAICELLLEELSIYNNSEIFEEINPLINQLLKIAEESNSFSTLSETYLLQGRVALIRLNLDDARRYLTIAQQIADEHDLTMLARKISHEHDKLVEDLETWQNFKKTQVSMSKRIKLASIDGVIDRMQEKRAIDPPELVAEQATLLLIIAEGGVLVFSYPFTDEWKQDDSLFSSFLSAFTSFSDEFFSEGLDRAKFGQNTVLMESIGSFSVCYLYKGQTYPAQQNLSKFTEAIQNNASIWPILEKFYKTSQVLEIKDSPFLEHLITNIFPS